MGRDTERKGVENTENSADLYHNKTNQKSESLNNWSLRTALNVKLRAMGSVLGTPRQYVEKAASR